jgi:hypothetical protein
MSYTIAVPSSSIQKVLTYGIPSITSVSGGVAVANGTVTITSSYPSLPPVNDPAFAQANVATGIATSGYNQANTATNLAQTVYNFANTIGGGSAVDNVARVLASSASSNTIIIQGVNITQNNNIVALNNNIVALNNYASGAYEKANSALSNTSGTLSGSLYVTSALGVGTAPSGIIGEIRATNEVTAYYSSDETLKENIVVIDNALSKLRQIRGVMYDWKDSHIQSRGGLDDYFVRKHDTGVIAQDVEKVLPEVVAERPDGTKAVRYEKLAGIMIQAINELADQVEEIKKRLN